MQWLLWELVYVMNELSENDDDIPITWNNIPPMGSSEQKFPN